MPDSDSAFGGRSPRLWLRVERNDDKAFYAQVREAGDGYILNANLAEAAAASSAAFLDHMARPFCLDPISYRMGNPKWIARLDADKNTVDKRNYLRLWRKLSSGVDAWSGEPLRDDVRILAGRAQDISRYCANVLTYQDAQLRDTWIDEVSEFMGMDGLLSAVFAPRIYLAPYVTIDAGTVEDDIDLAVDLARTTAQLGQPRLTFAVLPIAAAVLEDVPRMTRLGTRLARSGVRGTWIWPVGLRAVELADRPSRFTGLVTLLRILDDGGLESAALYGGYLSGLLRYFGLDAVSHALTYGESRGLDPTNGRDSATFYWRPLHRPIPYALARRFLEGLSRIEYLESVCGCPICEALTAGGLIGMEQYFQSSRPDNATRDIPLRESVELNRLHFLFCRAAEFEHLRQGTLRDLVDELLADSDRFELGSVHTLRAWAERLRTA